MGVSKRRRRVVLAAALAAVVVLAPAAGAQLGDDLLPPPTTEPPPPPPTEPPPPTTAPPATDPATPPATDPSAPPATDPAAPPVTDPGAPPTTATPVAPLGEVPVDPAPDGDGLTPPGGRIVPPDAQARIGSIARTGPSDNQALVDGVAALEAIGVPRADAVAQIYGAFPIEGPSRWTDDWLFPRYTGTTFRYHLGLDMFAAFGTPVRSPADGVARVSQSALGGLSVRVEGVDGTDWYLAHLSAYAEGLVSGQTVGAGQVVGFVGDSGNARGGAPHLHLGVYPGGGEAAPPKPTMDALVAAGAALVPELLAAARSAPASAPAVVAATDLTRRVAGGTTAALGLAPGGPSRTDLLWATSASPSGGALQVAGAGAEAAADGVDWQARADAQAERAAAWAAATETAGRWLTPLTPGPVTRAVAAHRATAAVPEPDTAALPPG